jgi:hypothetical protein
VTRDLDNLLAALDKLPPDQLPELIGALETAKARAWARLTVPSLEAVYASLSAEEHRRLLDEAQAGDPVARLVLALAPVSGAA